MAYLADIVDIVNLDIIERSRRHKSRLYATDRIGVMDKSITTLTVSDLT
jgi:hypothetical protein